MKANCFIQPRTVAAFLFLLGITTASFGKSEQALRNDIKIQKEAVSNLEASVKNSRGDLEAKQKVVSGVLEEKKQLQIRKKDLASAIITKKKAKELTERRLNRQIAALEAELQSAADAGEPSEALVAIQKRTNRYRDKLKTTKDRYRYAGQIATLENQWEALVEEEKKFEEKLFLPNADLKTAQEILETEEGVLQEAKAALQDLMKRSREELNQFAPPVLEEITVLDSSGKEVYAAHWNPGELEVDFRIRNLEKLMIKQQKVINERNRQVDYFYEETMKHQRNCDKLMSEYTDAVMVQAYQSIGIELADSALTICWDLPELGPYAVVLEAGDRLVKVATGTAARDYSIPDEGALNTVVASTARSQVDGSKRNAIKSSIKAVIGSSSVPTGSRDFLGYDSSGFRVTHDNGPLTDIGSGLGHIYHSALGLKAKIKSHGVSGLIETVDVKKAWNGMQSNLKGRLFEKGAVTEFGKGFARDQLQGAFVEELLSQASEGKNAAWQRYVREDALRSVALSSFKSLCAIRRVDMEVLASMNELMDELIEERNAAENVRSLMRTVDEIATQGESYRINLRFSGPIIEVKSVTVGDIAVESDSQRSGANWSGTVTLENLGEEAAITIEAVDSESSKRLDSPVTIAYFVPEKDQWNYYEPEADQSHRLRLEAGKPDRSFVIAIDCSGSMEGGKMEQAKASARALFKSGRFQEGDEISLYTFSNGVLRVVGFTMNHDSILASIDELASGGGTPLARTIRQAGQYLYTQGTGAEKAMIVLTDGEDSEGGNVGAAVSTVRRMKQMVEMGL